MPLDSPRRAEPGPGEWDTVDLDGRCDVSGGQLVVTGTSAAFDRTTLLLTRPFSRRRGRYLEMQWTPSALGDWALTWQNGPWATQGSWEAGVRFTSDGMVGAVDGRSGFVGAKYPYTAGTAYVVRVYDGGPSSFSAAGGRGDFFVYIRPQAASTWSLLWRKRASASHLTQVYAAINNKDAPGTSSFCRIRQAKLPPLQAGVAQPIHFQKVCGGVNGLHEVTIAAPSSGVAGLTFRGTDANNLWKLVMDVGAQKLRLYLRVAGVDALVLEQPQSWSVTKPYVLAALTDGKRIRTFLGREEKMSVELISDPAITEDQTGILDNAEYMNLRVDRSGMELQW